MILSLILLGSTNFALHGQSTGSEYHSLKEIMLGTAILSNSLTGNDGYSDILDIGIQSNGNRKRTAFQVLGGGVTLWGVYLLSRSNQTKREYDEVRNEVVYQTNSFTQKELLEYQNSRDELLRKAKKQRRNGYLLTAFGPVIFGVSYFIPIGGGGGIGIGPTG